MLVYEVNLEVDTAIAGGYRAWLDAHVAGILTLPGFSGARILDVLEPAPPPDRIALCVQYVLRDRAAFDSYLHEHASRLRADSDARFGERVHAQRRLLSGTFDRD